MPAKTILNAVTVFPVPTEAEEKTGVLEMENESPLILSSVY